MPKQHKKLILNSDGTLKEVLSTVSGRKIPSAENTKRDLERCDQLGIVKGHTDQEYDHEQITERLQVLGNDENHLRDSPEQRKEQPMRFERTRHLIVWGGGWFNNIKP